MLIRKTFINIGARELIFGDTNCLYEYTTKVNKFSTFQEHDSFDDLTVTIAWCDLPLSLATGLQVSASTSYSSAVSGKVSSFTPVA